MGGARTASNPGFNSDGTLKPNPVGGGSGPPGGAAGSGGYGQNPGDAANVAWANHASGANPLLTNAQDIEARRNNFYYGGNAGGADVFNAQLRGSSFNSAMNSLADAGIANRNGMTAGATGQAAAGRDPQQFLDQVNMGFNRADRQSQVGAINGLNDFISRGPGPSAAQAQLNQATDANMGNALALARSGRGFGQSQSAMRQAIGQNAQTQQQAGNQSAMLRAQEAQQWQQNQLGAYGQIGNIAGQARQADTGAASYYTGSQQAGQNASDQTGLGYSQLQGQYLNAQMAAHQAGTSASLGYYGLQNNVNSQNLAAAQGYEGGQQGYYLGQLDPHRGENKGTDYTPYLAAGGAIVGSFFGPGGTAAGGAIGGAVGQATKGNDWGY